MKKKTTLAMAVMMALSMAMGSTALAQTGDTATTTRVATEDDRGFDLGWLGLLGLIGLLGLKRRDTHHTTHGTGTTTGTGYTAPR